MNTLYKILVLALLVASSSCSNFSKLNLAVDSNSRAAVRKSAFVSASSAISDLEEQKKYRQVYLDEITRMRSLAPKDTLVLTEYYNFACLGCAAQYVDIQSSDKVWLYEKNEKGIFALQRQIQSKVKPSEFNLYTFQVREIWQRIRKGESWNADASYYGNDKCKDGAHTFYTVFFPDGRVETLYVRCWTLRPDGAGHW